MSRPRRYATEPASDAGYPVRQGGVRVNWAAVGVIVTLMLTSVSFVWMAATQNSAINANHASETTAIASANAAITQLQSDERDNNKQTVEILLHLSSIDQTLKDWHWAQANAAVIPAPATGNTIIQQAPNGDGHR